MTKLAQLKSRWMTDPEFKAEYESLEQEFSLVRTLIEARARAGLTQEEVARRAGTTQSAIARMESGKANPSVRQLAKYAKATGSRLRVVLETEPSETRKRAV